MKKIYVDADACPVKDEVTKVAIRNNIITYMVCNGGIRPSKSSLIKLVIVSEGADEADKWIFNNIGNILATRDLMADLRSSDPFLKGKNKIFSKEDRSKFLNSLQSLI